VLTIVNPNNGPSLRFAFYGRVACDADDTAMTNLARQYERCERAVPPGAIVAVFYDIGAGSAFHRRPGPLTVGGRVLRRDGGIGDLLTESQHLSRRYDFVTACDPWRLSRDVHQVRTLLDRLRQSHIRILFPDVAEGIRTDGLLDLLLRPAHSIRPGRWRRLGSRGGRR
jgi:hypothetical protein